MVRPSAPVPRESGRRLTPSIHRTEFGIRYRSFRGRGDECRVFGHNPCGEAGFGLAPVRQAGFQFFLWKVHAQGPVLDVEGDGVAVSEGRYGAAVGRFGGDVAGHQAAGRTRETAVGQEGHTLAEALPDEGRGDAQHLAHSRTAPGAFVADHDHVTPGDVAGLHGGHGILLGIEDAGRSRVLQAGVAGDLDHAAFRREVAFENYESARGPEGLLDRDDHILSRRLLGLLDLLGEGATRGRKLGSVYEVGVEQPFAQQPAPTRAVDVYRGVAAAGLKVGDDRGATAHAVEVVDVEGYPDLAGYGEQVEDEVGRPSGGRPGGDAVLEGLAGQDAFWREAALEQLHDEPTGARADFILATVEGRRAGRAHGREAQELEDHGHRVRRVLASARPRPWAGVLFEIKEVLIGHLASGVGSDPLEDILDRHVVALEAAGGNGAGVDDGARYAEPGVGHRGSWDRLVTAD